MLLTVHSKKKKKKKNLAVEYRIRVGKFSPAVVANLIISIAYQWVHTPTPQTPVGLGFAALAAAVAVSR